MNFAEVKELEGLLDAIEVAEQSVAATTARLSDPATYTRGGTEVAELRRELDTAKSQVERLTARWEELENK